MQCYIRENSWIAHIAAWKLKSQQVAIVIGKTVHLYQTSREAFLKNTHWVRHEVAHIRQFEKYGFLPFIIRYLLESLKSGYHKNRYEIEARQAEQDVDIASSVEF